MLAMYASRWSCGPRRGSRPSRVAEDSAIPSTSEATACRNQEEPLKLRSSRIAAVRLTVWIALALGSHSQAGGATAGVTSWDSLVQRPWTEIFDALNDPRTRIDPPSRLLLRLAGTACSRTPSSPRVLEYVPSYDTLRVLLPAAMDLAAGPPPNAKGQVLAGFIFALSGQPVVARAYYDRAIRMDPSLRTLALTCKAMAWIQQEAEAEALPLLLRAIADDSTCAHALRLHADLSGSSVEIRIRNLTRAIAIQPDYYRYFELRAEAYRGGASSDRSLEALAEADEAAAVRLGGDRPVPAPAWERGTGSSYPWQSSGSLCTVCGGSGMTRSYVGENGYGDQIWSSTVCYSCGGSGRSR